MEGKILRIFEKREKNRDDRSRPRCAAAEYLAVPADSTLVVTDKNSQLYLDETDLLRVQASANSDLTYTISGEILDDA